MSRPQCKCTFVQHMLGDGCDVCNPTLALELAREQYEAEQRAAAQAPAEPGYSVDPAGAFCDEE